MSRFRSSRSCQRGASAQPVPDVSELALIQNRFTLAELVGSPQDWRYTWQIRDDVTLSSACGFCSRALQRVTYEVVRDANALWICENCVRRYDIGAEIGGEMLGPKAARAYAHGLTARLKQQTCHDLIRRVQATLPDAELEEVAVYFDRNLQLSPQCAARLFATLVQIGEETSARVFEVQTRSKAHQQEFGDLADAERRLVWIALSPQQRRRLASLGFAPEGTVIRRSTSRRRSCSEPELAASRIAVLSEVAVVDLVEKD
jgi:hypothetical protein